MDVSKCSLYPPAGQAAAHRHTVSATQATEGTMAFNFIAALYPGRFPKSDLACYARPFEHVTFGLHISPPSEHMVTRLYCKLIENGITCNLEPVTTAEGNWPLVACSTEHRRQTGHLTNS